MKRLFTFLFVIAFAQSASAQDPKPKFMYLKSDTGKIFLLPDSTMFSTAKLDKNKTTIMIYFGPDCGHCIAFTKRMVDSIELLKHTQIVMVSSFEMTKIRKFYEDQNLSQCANIRVGKDRNFEFIGNYNVRTFPSAFIFDKTGKFVKSFNGDIEIKELAAKAGH